MIKQRVCIVGLGLIGGSLAHALKGQARLVIGVDRHAATRQQALADGVVDAATDTLAAGISQADLVILATPVQTILDILQELPAAKPAGCLVLDMGSTKVAINESMSALPDSFSAIGGHPMCGKETAGYTAADPLLFTGKTFILTRNARTNKAIESISLDLVDLLGARPLFLSAQEHDYLVAAVSHMPYLLSAALMHTVAKQQDSNLWQTSASGFRDMARLAGSDPHMLYDILLTNKAAVLEHLQRYQVELESLILLLKSEDTGALAGWLSAAQREHSAYRQAKQKLE